MVPETCVPTCTVVTACSVPVAPTVSAMSPRVTAAVDDGRLGALLR